MKKLSKDFTYQKYGLHVRFVNESDAQFILSIRTNAYKSKFIGGTNNSIDQQIEWIRNYKSREAEGTDYYFMYLFKGKRVGVNRLYDLSEHHFNHGSWVFSTESPQFCSFAAAIIAREIAFDILDIPLESNEKDGVFENNARVVKFQKTLGMDLYGQRIINGQNVLYGTLTKDTFNKMKDKVLRFIPKEYINQ